MAPPRGRGPPLPALCLLLAAASAARIPLSVPQVPTITRQSGEQVALPFDEHFLMECEATGNPQPQFSWTKDGKPFDLSDPRIVVSSGSGTFTIPNDGHVAAFQGKYRCFAANRLGVAMSEEISFVVPNIPKFPKENIEPLEVEEGDPVVLPCSPPRGLPPLHIYWMNIDLQHIEQDERVYVSQRGDLYFAHVEERDSRSDYCCFAAFPRLRTIVQKMPLKLTVSSFARANGSRPPTEAGPPANSIKQRKPRLLLPPAESGPETSVTVLKGHTLLLECFAEGLPTPRVEWRKTGADLPQGREAQGSFGSSLRIEAVTGRDGGTYRCTASNALGAATHDFRVAVEEPPRWTRKPQSSVYSSGSSGILLCAAAGEPEPTIRWLVNGAPIENSPFAGDVVSPGEVSFTNLQPSHTAVYQCEASNTHGALLASASVDVVDMPPLIQTADEERYAAVVGRGATLHCQFFASPQAVVTWQKVEAARALAGSHYVVHENGSLHIPSASADDAGAYSCWVENALGKTAVTASLDVRNATQLRVSPQSPRVARAHTLELHCSSTCDAHLRPSLRLSWGKDGAALAATEDGRILIDGATLTLSNITLQDQGAYSCSAHTALDSAVDVTQVTVTDVPDPPEDLRLSDQQNRSVRLAWRAGDDHHSPVSEFVVEFEGNREEPGRWEELARVPGADTAATLSLAPYVRYRFRVRAVNEVGISVPSRPSDHLETPPAAPDKNPQNVRVQASQPKEMVIRWEPLKPMEQNGPGLQYRVAWRPQGASVEWGEETVTNHTLRVMTSAVYAPYEVQVQAVNQLGAGPEPPSVTLYSGEDYPDAAPVVQGVEVVNSSLAKVTWSAVPPDRVHGRLRGYQVSWWKTRSLLDGRAPPKAVSVLRFPGERSSGLVPSLDAFSEFRLTVLAFNSRGAGPESEPFVFQTPEGVPEQPAFLKVVTVDRDTATLAWGLPRRRNGNLTGYVLQFQNINDSQDVGELNEVRIAAPAQPGWRLSQLNATTKYKFYVRACTAQGCGPPVSEEGATLGAGRKGAGRLSAGVNLTLKSRPVEVFEPGAEPVVRLVTKNWVDNNSIFEDVIETRGRERGGLDGAFATQGWFIGLLCAGALLTLALLTVCFVRRNKGGKYSVKEKEDQHPDPEGQSGKEETFGDYSDSDEKPLQGSLPSLRRDLQAAPSADSLEDFGEGGPGLFGEDGSFIGAYAGAKEKGSVGSTGSSTATFPLRA